MRDAMEQESIKTLHPSNGVAIKDNANLVGQPPLAVREPLANMIQREDVRQKRNLKIRWLVSALVVAVVGFGLWYLMSPKTVPLSLRFRTGVVSADGVTRQARATGDVQAVTTIQVGAEVSGRIDKVPVDYNTLVHSGQVLAQIEPTLYQAQLDEASGQLLSAQAALDQATSNRDHIARDLARAESLFAKNLIPVSELDTDTSNLRVAQETVAAARANVAAMKGSLEVARANLGYCTIRSRINGIVVSRNIDSGQTIASVFQTPVLFSVAADLKQMRVVAAVDEADIGELAEGQQATFTVNAYPDRVFSGVVTQVRNAPVILEDVVTYGTVITVDNSDLALKPGMTATVGIVTATSKRDLKVPNAALHFTPPTEKADSVAGVWVLDHDRFRRIHLRPGVSDGEWTEIVDGEITPGTTVLLELTPDGKKAYAK
jgi:HlyD family secretion protein